MLEPERHDSRMHANAQGRADPMSAPPRFAPRCISIDLEVNPGSGRIEKIAAVRADTGAVYSYSYSSGDLPQALQALDALTEGAAFVIGHNLVAFDLPHLRALAPNLRLLKLPAVDTLMLNPLAFARNPYHRLVKHYQDAQLKHGQLNDPELDARGALTLFHDQLQALREIDRSAPALLIAWHWLTTAEPADSGLNALFTALRGKPRPNTHSANAALHAVLEGRSCATHAATIVAAAQQQRWPLAYALAWLNVAGGNSVLSPWVSHQFPDTIGLLQQLRDRACHNPDCTWCAAHHNPTWQLKHWFGAELTFRPEPRDPHTGQPLQELIVRAAMAGESVLGILPTGTGKSLCYQLPALARYDHIGALTVVISPLVALMADQVSGLQARGHSCVAAFNGLLSMPERADVLDAIRLGDIGILLISPEQLRNRSLRRCLAQRHIGAWVLDEAHCISKWGQDFRPDYRYISRFIAERAGDHSTPPVLCLTATAKVDVIEDICAHFKQRLATTLRVFDGGASRTNLYFDVVPIQLAAKFDHVAALLRQYLPLSQPGGAIVYCATRRQTEELAEFLTRLDFGAACFHAGLSPEIKKDVQQGFIGGSLRVIVATNAFGMGIDKPDVRLVIHADIPGSLENYLQEAGRAGRDRDSAQCVLLYAVDDVERQFGMSARSRLSQRDIQTILRSLRALDRRKRGNGELIATAGEILSEDQDAQFQRDQVTDDTRVKTALSWLEEAQLLTREENRVQVFASSLRVNSIDAAKARLANRGLSLARVRQLLAITAVLIDADPTDGVSTDELMLSAGLSAEQLRAALFDLEHLGIASNDAALTAFVHLGVANASSARQALADAQETALIAMLREHAPDLAVGEHTTLNLRLASQQLHDLGHDSARPPLLLRLLRSLSADGRSESGGVGSISLKRVDAETVSVRLQRDWSALAKSAALRRSGAQRVLAHLLSCLPEGSRGTDLLAATTLGRLTAAITSDLLLSAQIKDPPKLLDRALLWLHEQEVIRLHKGLQIFRPAMTLRLSDEKRGFAKVDFEPLAQHYRELGVQIHVMAEYAERGLAAIADALALTADYFSLTRAAFVAKWLPNREKELALDTTPASWRAIVEDLRNPIQQAIVADERERSNVLVLAGPGAGKTRVLVHRIGYLVRVRRENPRHIVALAYNHHAAIDIRRRLHALIGADARGITVLTCHALAMRLVGASFSGRERAVDSAQFSEVLQQAIALLNGSALEGYDADAQREQLLQGFRWILVDEYQDIGADQYALISALAGRSRPGDESRPTLFAVGDDDQNIYAFNGASVAFIRQFEADYASKPAWLTENYRASAHLIAAANQLIATAPDRLKVDHAISIDRRRRKHPPGGEWQRRDAVGQGRVQWLPAGTDAITQAQIAVAELQRLAALDEHWDWTQCAVIAREWRYLEPLRNYCEYLGIPVQMANEDALPFWRLRETQALVHWLRHADDGSREPLVTAPEVLAWLAPQRGPWWQLLQEAVSIWALEVGAATLPSAHLLDWLAEWGREIRRPATGLLLLTAHRAKGLEFFHVVILDGGWDRRSAGEDPFAATRLYYVAMTRARATLALLELDAGNALLAPLRHCASVQQRARLALGSTPPGIEKIQQRLSPADVDLSFAGRFFANHRVHAAIAAANAGDPLLLRARGQRLELLNNDGVVLGRLAQAYELPAPADAITLSVAAVLVRGIDDSSEAFIHTLATARWEVIIPQLRW